MYSIKRWFKNLKSIFIDFLAVIGSTWVIVEFLSYVTNSWIDTYTKNGYYLISVLIFSLIVSLLKNKPKKSFSYMLRDKDNYIEVNVGDAFSNEGALVIPINDQFDVSLGGNVKKAKSLQNKLIKDFYLDKDEHLETDISNKIDISLTHEIGTTIEIEQTEKTFYLLVNSRKKDNNRVESTIDDFLLSLSRLWEFIALESGRNKIVTIPLISTNHGRIANFNRTKAIREIIYSYIDSSKQLNIADKLIISIHPSDLEKGDIDIDGIEEYLKYSSKHFRIVNISSKQEGEEITSSNVIGIEN